MRILDRIDSLRTMTAAECEKIRRDMIDAVHYNFNAVKSVGTAVDFGHTRCIKCGYIALGFRPSCVCRKNPFDEEIFTCVQHGGLIVNSIKENGGVMLGEFISLAEIKKRFDSGERF